MYPYLNFLLRIGYVATHIHKSTCTIIFKFSYTCMQYWLDCLHQAWGLPQCNAHYKACMMNRNIIKYQNSIIVYTELPRLFFPCDYSGNSDDYRHKNYVNVEHSCTSSFILLKSFWNTFFKPSQRSKSTPLLYIGIKL